MKASAKLALAAVLSLAPLTLARADDNVLHTVLSAEDVQLYRTIFRAEEAGESAKADAAIAKLADKSLTGYVLQIRYLGSHHRSTFGELKSWLEEHGDIADADRIHKLAMKRAPKGARVPTPPPVKWRGAPGEGTAFADMELETDAARKALARMRGFERDNKAEESNTLLKTVSTGSMPQADKDRLGAYVAALYLSEAKNDAALALAEDIAARDSEASAQCHWTAALAAYRLDKFEVAAKHFEAVSSQGSAAKRTSAAGAFWAARSWMRSGQPERVLPLYRIAAAQPDNFYGLLAARLMGSDEGANFTEPTLENGTFALLMLNRPAHRAVALWQIGHRAEMQTELARALGDIAPDLDAPFAALARHLDTPTLELRAAELASAPDFRLSSLYPVPSYKPQNGFSLDPAMLLAFARQESRFATDAVSKSGARGLMQIMPRTAALVARDPSLAGVNKVRLDDPTYSMTLGQDYLRTLLQSQGNSLIALAAAYNAGSGNLSRWMAVHEGIDDPLLFVESIPVSETRDYVKRVMMNLWMYRKRLGEPVDGLDDTASGAWPVYKQTGYKQTGTASAN